MGVVTGLFAELYAAAERSWSEYPTAVTWLLVASLVVAAAIALGFARVNLSVSAAVGAGGGGSAASHGFTWTEVPPDGADPEFGGGHARLVSTRMPVGEQRARASAFRAHMATRRSLRFFSPDPVDDAVLTDAVAAAGTAPSGAHKQPWVFCVVRDAAVKQRIRELVEAEEIVNYERRMRKTWVDDVDHLVNKLHGDEGVPSKPYLSEAPALVVVFKEMHGVDESGERVTHYYVEESVGIAVGILMAALHNVGLATLTSTPMGAESKIRDLLGRGKHEKVFLLLPVGYPAADATVPFRGTTQQRKPLDKLMPRV